MANLTVSEINSFSGGMNTVTAAYLIARDEASLLINVNVRRGAMWPMPKIIFYESVESEFFFQYKFDVYSYDNFRSNVLWDNRWYWSDGLDTGKVHEDGIEYPLGIATPINTPSVSVSGSVGTGSLVGDIKYAYTFYNNDTGVESAPSKISVYAKTNEQDVIISNFEALPPEATHYRLYRIGGYLPYFMLVDMFTATSYTDSLDDTEIDGRTLETIRNGPPPAAIKYFTELNGRMYGSVGNIVYFSAIGNPDSWYIYDFIPCKDTIIGIAKSPGGLIILGRDWANVLRGSGPENFVLKTISENIGMVNIKSLAYIDDSALWLSKHGLVMSDGRTIRQLTMDKIHNMSNFDPVAAITLNNVYYMVFKPGLYPSNELFPDDKQYPASILGTGGLGEGIVLIDFNRGRGFSYQLLDYPRAQYIDVLNGDIGLVSGNAESHGLDCAVIAFPSCGDNIRCGGYDLGYLAKYTEGLFDDINLWTELSYISPKLVDGTTTTLKEYDKVRVVHRGEVHFIIMFDNDRIIIDKLLPSAPSNPDALLNLPDATESIIGIPNKDNKAYSIRFGVFGRCVVEGIQYSYKMRDLP